MVLESKLLFLEHDNQVEEQGGAQAPEEKDTVKTKPQAPPSLVPRMKSPAERIMPRKGWWARFLKKC